MIVEFVGAAGVGKTYFADRLVSLMQRRGVDARSFFMIPISRFSAKNVRDLVRASYLSFKTRPVTGRQFFRNATVIGSYAIRRRIGASQQMVGITCEGLFHQIITMKRQSRGLGANDLADILFAAIEPPDVVVLLDGCAEAVFARRRSRNRSNDVFDLNSVKQDLQDARAMVGVIEKVRANRKNDLELVVLDTDANAGTDLAPVIAARIADIVMRRCQYAA